MGEKLSLKTISRVLNTSYPTLRRLAIAPVAMSGNPQTRHCDLYDVDEVRERLEEFRAGLKEQRAKIPLKLSERNVTSRSQEIGDDLAGYLDVDYAHWKKMHREASRSLHRCEVCGEWEIDLPIFRNLCQECWCGLLLYFMSFLKDDGRPQCEREDPLVFALRMAKNMEDRGMPAFTHAAKLANPERMGAGGGGNRSMARGIRGRKK